MSEEKVIDADLEAFLSPLQPGECSEEHNAWMKAQIKATLAKKKAGTMTYRSLDEVMAKFGFNAR